MLFLIKFVIMKEIEKCERNFYRAKYRNERYLNTFKYALENKSFPAFTTLCLIHELNGQLKFLEMSKLRRVCKTTIKKNYLFCVFYK